MRRMEQKALRRRLLPPDNELIRGLEDSLLNISLNASSLSVKTNYIHSLAFNLNCTFAGLSLNSATQEEAYQAQARHAMQFPAVLTRGACKNRARDLRLICIYFSNSYFFKSDVDTPLLNNYVLGAQLGREHVENLSEPINISFWHNHSLVPLGAPLFPSHLCSSVAKDYIPTCVFWKKGASQNYWGGWSPEGCRTEQPSSSQVLCRCNHLTYFAVLMQLSPVSTKLPEKLLNTLTSISIVGCSVSIVASLLTIVLHFHDRKQNNATTRIHINLHVSVLLLNVAFLLSPVLASPSVPSAACTALAAILHWALLSCFTWMVIEGFNLYILLGRVYNVYFRRYVLKLCVVGWGAPTFLVLLVLAIKSSVYGPYTIPISDSQGNSTGLQNQSMCWVRSPTVHAVLVMGYGGLTCLLNLVVLVWVQRLLCRLRAREKVLGTRACQDTVTVLGLTVLLGTTWALGFFSFGVFLLPQLFLFTIFNSLHGFFLFLWFCYQKCHSETEAKSEMETFSSSRQRSSLIS
ncbi:Adhesion G-protein coupled receptor G5 [Galemys pyrenaicus]|uniref:Adhesion G-protein coupled receptor G5 n=1 Tax=Galemys pyrenaicus TaxID=202257 RepID=A0A8J6AMX1_GALPY|nr:Adhesion G-protein coupled receptor G5 [Galemys pyrenaicus]